MKKIYLACPYSDPDMNVCAERVRKATEAAARIMLQGYCVFSPLTHSHPIALSGKLDHLDHNFWLAQDLPFLVDWADELWVLALPGWQRSLGVKIELVNAAEFGIPAYLYEVGRRGPLVMLNTFCLKAGK